VRDTRDDGIGGVVAEIVVRLLSDGPPDVASVAKAMGVSVRTLQRRLLAAGLTFVGIVARARLDVARQLLDDPARRVIDVALDLGYSDHAHFTRAFARWTGLAPRDFRRRAYASREAICESAVSTKREIVVETTRRVA
jgi:AraC-like DNA-binding protein